MLKQLIIDLKALSNPGKAKFVAGYFKSWPGQYGEGDKFRGITVPEQRKVAKRYFKELTLNDLDQLLQSPVHEQRFTWLEALVMQYNKADELWKKQIIDFYVKHFDRVNNRDLVDTSAPYLLGDRMFMKSRKPLYQRVKSMHLWTRRIAVLTTFGFIKNGDFEDSLKLAELLLNDSHDLIHKAVGRMLREIGKKDERVLLKFLDAHVVEMPRTMLRYAIERLDEQARKSYLNQKVF